jgi:hypothetical protein
MPVIWPEDYEAVVCVIRKGGAPPVEIRHQTQLQWPANFHPLSVPPWLISAGSRHSFSFASDWEFLRDEIVYACVFIMGKLPGCLILIDELR